MKIVKKKASAVIPTSSMADIAFLLLVFFMTTTILKEEQGLDVTYPLVEQATKTDRENTAHIWIKPITGAKKTAMTVINDVELKSVEEVRRIMQKKREKNLSITVAMNVDERSQYKDVHAVLEQLRQAHTYRIYFISTVKGK